MRTRLRPAYDDFELHCLYALAAGRPPWHGHAQRIAHTVDIGREMWRGGRVADLSCGDGMITTAMGVPDELLTLGDITSIPAALRPGIKKWWGSIEETIDLIDPVELFICSETLEHIDDPDALLVKIRGKCEQLLLSTPCNEPINTDNAEHYWSWHDYDVSLMLGAAGYHDRTVELLTIDGFTFQIWRAA